MTRLSYDPDHTAAFYDGHGEREAQRWEKDARTRFEFEVYRSHVVRRVKEGDRVLDAGCGPGTFTRVVQACGARPICFDISAVQLEACREAAPGADAYVRGSVTDLSAFDTDAFDVTLALGGPLSYCFDRAADAVAEMRRVTRPGGWVGLSVMSLWGTVHRFLPGILPLPVTVNEAIVRTGDLPREVNDGHECHLFRPAELRSLLADGGLRHLELHSSGWLVPNGEVELPEPGSEALRILMEAELRASAETPGAGTHIIAWGVA